jgi:hypothetical protein
VRVPLAACLALLACAVAAAPAGAVGFAAPRTAAGPSGDVLELGGLGFARDGTGVVAYLMRDGGQPHVFASRLRRGDPTASVRVDSGQLTASSEVRVATADGGRTVVAWVNAGLVYAALKPSTGAPFEAPRLVCACGPVSDPSLEISKFGTAYLTFTAAGAGGHDVRAAVLDASETTDWELITLPVDIDAAADAQGARVTASADGTAIVAWSERATGGVARLFERRLLGARLSTVPKQVSLGRLSGRRGGDADSPALDVQDESSFVWIAFRQTFVDGGRERSRVIARRLRGSAFDKTFQLDGLRGFPASRGAARPAIGMSGRGYGVAVASMQPSNGLTGAALTRSRDVLQFLFERPLQLAPSSSRPPLPVVSSAESTHSMVAWQQAGGGSRRIRTRYFDGRDFRGPVTISRSGHGPTVAELGLDSGGDDADDHVFAFVQGRESARRIQVVVYSGELDVPTVDGYDRPRHERRPRHEWPRIQNVAWGPVRYRLEVDGRRTGLTTATSLRVPRPLRDGLHRTRLVAVDARGSVSRGDYFDLRIDAKSPDRAR